ncbi:MAG: thioredoxin [Candidatus Thermoplasmatota archaeon]|nr:thioredoxin [Candidatus Thermoplasmatota archaeon]
MLRTKLKHLQTKDDIKKALNQNENVMICAGRMGPMCIPVYKAMMELERGKGYDNVTFYDMDFDIPEADYIRSLPECADFMGLPFTVYFKKGKVVAATSSIQTKDQVEAILKREFKK